MGAQGAVNFRWQGGQRHMLVLTGPRSGTVQPIPFLPPSSSSSIAIRREVWDALLEDDGDRISKRARVAATSEAIHKGLREVAGRFREGEECAVCLQDLLSDETLGAMPCSHAFHHHCISQWLRRNAACPICRRRLPAAATEEDEVVLEEDPLI
ncbi:unnamed protein product [Urochloa decumbens]|uniref:RING-type domain-containing protein n=1 Tax=Urochloa decumbens TaxID=240449 RepID=A0ABC8Y173_9POAL